MRFNGHLLVRLGLVLKILFFCRFVLVFSVVNKPVIVIYGCNKVAVQAGKVDKIRCLLALGADARATDLNGNTYFHLAARDGRTEVLEAFIGDVDVTGANNDGDTALHLAAKSGYVDAVKLLLQKSKLDARNKYAESNPWAEERFYSRGKRQLDKSGYITPLHKICM